MGRTSAPMHLALSSGQNDALICRIALSRVVIAAHGPANSTTRVHNLPAMKNLQSPDMIMLGPALCRRDQKAELPPSQQKLQQQTQLCPHQPQALSTRLPSHSQRRMCPWSLLTAFLSTITQTPRMTSLLTLQQQYQGRPHPRRNRRIRRRVKAWVLLGIQQTQICRNLVWEQILRMQQPCASRRRQRSSLAQVWLSLILARPEQPRAIQQKIACRARRRRLGRPSQQRQGSSSSSELPGDAPSTLAPFSGASAP